MQSVFKIVFAASAVSAITLNTATAETSEALPASPINGLISKGIEKIQEEARDEKKAVLFDLIKAEFDDEEYDRYEVLEGMREACYSQYGDKEED